MSSHKEELIWGGAEHPTLEELRQYQENTLPSAESLEVEQHLLTCDICTDVVDGMVLADRATTRNAVHSINFRLQNLKQPKKKRRLPAMPLLDWRAAAAIVALLCSLALVIYYQYTQFTKERPPAVTVANKPTELSPAAPAPLSEELREEVFAPEPAAGTETPTAPATVGKQAPFLAKKELKVETNTLNTLDFKPLTTPPVAATSTKLKEDSTTTSQAGFQTQAAPGATVAKARAGESSKLAKVPQSSKLAGRVLSETGEGLPGVTVVLRGANTGAATDLEGNFTLPAPTDSGTLVFNYIGYETAETTIDATTSNLQISLFPNTSALSEVVVTGYATAAATPATMVAPRPVGGTSAFNKYIKANLKYPEAARAANIKGKVVVAFTVLPNGQIANLQVTKSLHPACDAEAKRLVQQGPAWQPATSNGTPTSQQVKVTIRFKP
ncbi:TonB family protein [Pontibacter qinzhouensis]|uniref:TonB family protein n=1 Tax=Pontibacter qinzhouensis TaxID=2603253 RepID=A0A5C8KCT9_9BACT|nr:energy transducer TonB [Pontibacter qinzhouensis]TXK48900.1 TonB family protein [Pontibacter qinzhouensis]